MNNTQQLKDELTWLKGRKIVVCEPNAERLAEMTAFLENYGLTVVSLPTAEAVMAEIEARRYSTIRVYLAILIDYHLAAEVERCWRDTTSENPTILRTPVVLMREDGDMTRAMSLVQKGYFRFQLAQPVAPTAMLRLLRRLNRWKKWQREMSEVPQPSAILGEVSE